MINSVISKLHSYLFKKNKKLSPGDIADLCKSNRKDDYDTFWNNEDLIAAYMEPARIEGYNIIVDHILTKQIAGKVVDVGFGSGDFLRILMEKSQQNQFSIHGLDYSEVAVSRAKRIIPDGNFLTGEVNNLPYEDNFFNLVTCIQTLEHLSEPHKVINEFDRVCSSDGLIIISVPNGEFDSYEGHVNFWTHSQFRDFLKPREIVDFILFNNDKAFLATIKPFKKTI